MRCFSRAALNPFVSHCPLPPSLPPSHLPRLQYPYRHGRGGPESPFPLHPSVRVIIRRLNHSPPYTTAAESVRAPALFLSSARLPAVTSKQKTDTAFDGSGCALSAHSPGVCTTRKMLVYKPTRLLYYVLKYRWQSPLVPTSGATAATMRSGEPESIYFVGYIGASIIRWPTQSRDRRTAVHYAIQPTNEKRQR